MARKTLPMRRSRQVLAPLLASTAVALLAGCRGPEMQRCVDENNHVVDPVFCKDLPPGSTQPLYNGGHAGGGGGVYVPHTYRYYYGGDGSYAPGSSVSGGGFAPAAGHSYSTTTGTARGGFGSSFGGGEGGEGGGHGGGGGE